LRRQFDPGANSIEQMKAKIALQLAQLVAHRTAREIQVVRGPPDSAETGETFQCAHRLS
jgi:hypothetical protein